MVHFVISEERRAEVIGLYIVEEGATVRAASARFGISKSTVHKDVTTDLRIINPTLFAAVAAVLEKNKSERHLRGGEATRQKYQKTKRKKETDEM
ncbi:MAG: sporulation transcriptional regulator SpoIIID [Clostridia bacterium]|nr:sporulation transcriptional regulator SpoIIID [Clostridia bacterium]